MSGIFGQILEGTCVEGFVGADGRTKKMKITLDIPNTVVAAVLTILRDESTHFILGTYNIGPDEIRDGAIIILPRDEAKESPNSDLPRGCWRVENFDDVRATFIDEVDKK